MIEDTITEGMAAKQSRPGQWPGLNIIARLLLLVKLM